MNFIQKITNEQLLELRAAIRKERDAQAVRTIQAIILLEEKTSASTIEVLTGYQREVAVKLRRKYLKKGIESLRSKKRVPTRLFLTRSQREKIVEILNNQKPSDFGYNQDFWTTTVLADLIAEQWGLRYKSKTSIYIILRKADFTFRKPEKWSEKRNPEAIEAWKKEYESIIKTECDRTDSVVLVGDEAVLTSSTRTQRVWLPLKNPAYVEDTVKRKTVHLYGFLEVVSGVAWAMMLLEASFEVSLRGITKQASGY